LTYTNSLPSKPQILYIHKSFTFERFPPPLRPPQALALGGQTLKDLKGLDKLLSAKKGGGGGEGGGGGGHTNEDSDRVESDWDADMSSHASPQLSGRASRLGEGGKGGGGGSMLALRKAPAALLLPDDARGVLYI